MKFSVGVLYKQALKQCPKKSNERQSFVKIGAVKA